MRTFKSHFNRVQTMMGWDDLKTAVWFKADNPLLGGGSPNNMIRANRGARLRQFIDKAEEEGHARTDNG